jgi:hypothetical protein
VWVIKHTPTGGVLGYVRGNDTDDEYREAMWSKMQCPSTYDLVSDELKREQYTYTEMVNTGATTKGTIGVTRYSERSVSSTPVQQTGVRSWREFTYTCPKK